MPVQTPLCSQPASKHWVYRERAHAVFQAKEMLESEALGCATFSFATVHSLAWLFKCPSSINVVFDLMEKSVGGKLRLLKTCLGLLSTALGRGRAASPCPRDTQEAPSTTLAGPHRRQCLLSGPLPASYGRN